MIGSADRVKITQFLSTANINLDYLTIVSRETLLVAETTNVIEILVVAVYFLP
jgi:hypothetical protein